MDIELFLRKLACLLGFHLWEPNSGFDRRYFYPGTTRRCFWCGKRK